MMFLEKTWVKTGLLLIAAIAYLLLGYAVPRTNFAAVAGLFAWLFLVYFLLIRSGISVKAGLIAAIGFRLLLLGAVPALSDDYFRFLWDGRLIIAGENPFLHLPSFYAENGFSGIPGLDHDLFSGLNSPNYFSVYPPVCQFIFALAALMNPLSNLSGIIVMRLFIILAETGSFWLLLKLLGQFRLPSRNVLWYALNPLVIMELTGNLHFEALMLFFTLASFYFLSKNRYYFSAVALGLAVCTKLIPLLILPFLFKRMGIQNGIIFSAVTGLTCLVLFLPFITPELVSHFWNSLNLYFQKFEFNASIYFIFRWLGIYFTGYNQIAKIGPLLSGLTFVAILFLAYREKHSEVRNLPLVLLIALTIHYGLAPIVHPWYITTLVGLSVLTRLRYAYVWSGLAILSYAAYQNSSYTENPWLILLEYTSLATAIYLDLRQGSLAKNPEPVNA